MRILLRKCALKSSLLPLKSLSYRPQNGATRGGPLPSPPSCYVTVGSLSNMIQKMFVFKCNLGSTLCYFVFIN